MPPKNVVDRLLTFLDHAPDDEVYTRQEIETKLDCYIHSGNFIAQRRRYEKYRLMTVVNGVRTSVWGNKRAIRKLQQQLEAVRENR